MLSSLKIPDTLLDDVQILPCCHGRSWLTTVSAILALIVPPKLIHLSVITLLDNITSIQVPTTPSTIYLTRYEGGLRGEYSMKEQVKDEQVGIRV